MAVSWQLAVGREVADGRWRVAEATTSAVEHMARTGVASPVTTSVGRLFDAFAAIAGLRTHVTYEGQAAIELEAACDPAERGGYRFHLVERDGTLVLDPGEAIEAATRDTDAGKIAARFHNGLAVATARSCAVVAERYGVDLVVLSGGVFQNRRLLDATTDHLRALRLRVLTPRRLPANDGGISYGQAAVAALRRDG